MAHTVEVTENGSLTLPAEALYGAKPHTRYNVEARDDGLLLRAESVSAVNPAAADDWWEQWQAVVDDVSQAALPGTSALDELTRMRR